MKQTKEKSMEQLKEKRKKRKENSLLITSNPLCKRGSGLARLFSLLAPLSSLLFIISCAKMGQPDGGWYDEEPPRIIGEQPADRATGVTSRKVSILFDEFIKLENATEKVVISPPQLEQAEIKASGKRIVVELQDSLKPNTTYTIDFSDAISDNNEGNPLGNYTYTFSTGEAIDTMEVAGYVLEAESLEPVKGILVGLYDNLADSAFQKQPLLRVSRTDEGGHFIIKGVRQGQYRVYALQDLDNDYTFSSQAEKLAFSHDLFTTSSFADTRQDTIWRDSLHIATIERVPYTHFLPDEVALRAFTAVQTDRYFIKAERKQANAFTLFFSYGDEGLPTIQAMNFDATNAFVTEPSLMGDTITYWLRDTTLVNQDTLRLAISYRATDTLGVLQPKTDTLEVLSKEPYARRMKQQQEAFEKWQKKQEKAKKKGKPYEEAMPVEELKLKIALQGTIDPLQNPRIESPTPLAAIDTAAIHLYAKVDTTWYESDFHFAQLPGRLREWQLLKDGNWVPGTEYSLEIDSAAFTDIYGTASKAVKQGFKVRTLDEYGTLLLALDGMEGKPCVVQLLNGQDKPVMEEATTTGQVQFNYIKPATYYIRLFIDDNGDGLWTTGDYRKDQQPEAVYYYPREIECKAKWDITERWNPTALPLFRQKPAAITKQKASATKKTMRNKNAERARQLGIEYTDKRMNQ